MSCIKNSAVSRHWLFGVKKWCYYRRTFLCQAVCKHLIANSPCAQRACGVNRQGVRWEKELRLNKRDGSKYLARASVIFCFVWVFLVCFVMGVSYMTRGPKWGQGREKRVSETWRSSCEGMASWHKEQTQGQHSQKFGEDRGQEQKERKVLRRQQAWLEWQWWPSRGEKRDGDLGSLGVTQRHWGGLNVWDRGGRGERKEEGKRRWGWVWSRSGAGVDCSFPHCAGLGFSGVLCWRQCTTFYL